MYPHGRRENILKRKKIHILSQISVAPGSRSVKTLYNRRLIAGPMFLSAIEPSRFADFYVFVGVSTILFIHRFREKGTKRG